MPVSGREEAEKLNVDTPDTADFDREWRDALWRAARMMTGLDRATVDAIAAEMAPIAIPGGSVLFEAGEAADCLYFIYRGCLGVFERDSEDEVRLVNEVAAGETVGELSMIAGRRRSATVAALRDCELGRLSREAFERLARERPYALDHFLRFIVARLDRIIHHEAVPRPPRTFALLPLGDSRLTERFAHELQTALDRLGAGKSLLLTSKAGDRSTGWFHRAETSASQVLYLADTEPTPWTRLCLRQADRILIVGSVDGPAPASWPLEPESGRVYAPRRELVLVREGPELPAGRTANWLADKPQLRHHHVQLSTHRDLDRLARLMTDRAIGVVLAGGGARGFAHIGVYRALSEAGIAIDRVGGASMGALVGAGIAAGMDWRELRELFQAAFVKTNPLSDYTLPFVSLFSGRKVERLLRESYGETDIEDLPRPFFCTAANLTTGGTEIMQRGKLWRRLRASVSLPGILPPVLDNGQVLVDGGVMDNLPVEVMRRQGGGTVIGVDIETTGGISAGEGVETPWSAWQFIRRLIWRRNETLPFPSIVKILLRSALVNSEGATARQRLVADLVFRPPAANIDLLDWQSMDAVIEIGYRHAQEAITADRHKYPDGLLPGHVRTVRS